MTPLDILSTEKLSPDQLKIGYWYVSHKLLLRRLLILFLIAIDFILFVIGGFGLLDYYVFQQNEVKFLYNNLTTSKLNYSYLTEQSAPQDLAINFTRVISGRGQYDFISEIDNFNSTWYVNELTYHFEAGSLKTPTKTDFILPQSRKYLIAEAVSSDTLLNNATFVVEEIKWEKYAYFQELHDKILNIEILEPRFEAPGTLGVSDQLNVSRARFTAYNSSAYNFTNVQMKVIMSRGDSIVAVRDLSFQKFLAGEKRPIEFYLYDLASLPNRVDVFPDVDILNPAAFRGFEGEGEPK